MKKIAFVSGVLISAAALTLFLSLRNHNANKQLDLALAQVRALGAPTTAAEFAKNRDQELADAGVTAQAREQTAALFQAAVQDLMAITQSIPWGEYEGPKLWGRQDNGQRIEEIPDPLFAALEELGPALTSLATAGAAGPCYLESPEWQTVVDREASLGVLNLNRTSLTLLAIVSAHLERDEIDQAITAVEAHFALAEFVRNEPGTLSLTVHLVMWDCAIGNAMAVLPFVPNASEWIASLAGVEDSNDTHLVAETFATEVLSFGEVLTRIEALDMSYLSAPSPDGASSSKLPPHQKRMQAELFAHMAKVIAIAETPFPDCISAAALLDASISSESTIYVALFSTNMESKLIKYGKVLAHRRLLDLGARALDFRARTGHWPVALKELGTGLLMDPITGLPFVIEPTEDGGLLLRSEKKLPTGDLSLSWKLDA